MHTSILTLQSQLEQAKERLKEVEETIKKNTGRDLTAQTPRAGFKRNARHLEEQGQDGIAFKKRFSDGGVKGRLGDWGPPSTPQDRPQRLSIGNRIVSRVFPPRGQPRDVNKPRPFEASDGGVRVSAKKRLGEVSQSHPSPAVTVFSRLSGPPKEEEQEKVKITSQVLVQEMPSRKEILAAQNKDTSCKERNRRMFGALLGTLQKFRQEENMLREKEEKKALVEKKVEEAAEREKEEAKRARQELFSSRRQEQMNIRHIEFKLVKLKQLGEWEANKSRLMPFIQTEAMPKIFYLPRGHNDKTISLLKVHQAKIQKQIEKKREEVAKMIEDHEPTVEGEGEGEEERVEEEPPPPGEEPDQSSSSQSESESESDQEVTIKKEPVDDQDVTASDKENHTATVKKERDPEPLKTEPA